MIAIGVNVHKRKCTVAQQGGDGQLKMLPSIDNTREDWLEFLQDLPPDAEIALEVSTSGYFAMSVLEEAGWKERAHWVHTAGIDSLGARSGARRRGLPAAPEEVRELPEHAGGRRAPRRRAIVVRPAARSVGASPAAPLGGIRQHEQVQTGEQEQDEREQRQEAHPDGILFLFHGDEVDDDAHRKGNAHPAMGLPNPFVPVQ